MMVRFFDFWFFKGARLVPVYFSLRLIDSASPRGVDRVMFYVKYCTSVLQGMRVDHYERCVVEGFPAKIPCCNVWMKFMKPFE